MDNDCVYRFINEEAVEFRLNVDKITSIEDVKRVLNFLNITVKIGTLTQPNGYETVRDLFE